MNFTATIRDPSHSPGGALQPLRRRARRSAAGQAFHLVRAAGACSAVDVMHFFDTLTPDPEQVTEVHKFLPDDVPM